MKEQITYDIFDKVDIRLGTVLSVKKNEKASGYPERTSNIPRLNPPQRTGKCLICFNGFKCFCKH